MNGYFSFASIILCLLFSNTYGQKKIAITIDDPNTYNTPGLSWKERDSLLLKALDEQHVKAALFVCGMRVDNANGKELLNNWDEKGHLICNHSYSHFYYNAKSKTSEIFIADFKKGDSIISTYKNYSKYFRFPFLKEGNTAAKRDSMRTALKNEGYMNGHVTVDASDWYIDSQITTELNKDLNSDLIPYEEYYIKHILNRANYYDSLAQVVFERNVKHTLLLHHSLLNALLLDELLIALKADGWQLIDAEEAFKDEVFQLQPNIEPCGESIIWQSAKQTEVHSKNLRYPAEDKQYEKEPLKRYIEEYNLTKNKK
jgi:peptidoglycan/xylan/chitin deacetylase (PgdA/CDA1 family)